MVKFCVMAGGGSEFSLQAARIQYRLKPELQTGRAKRMAGRYKARSLLIASYLLPPNHLRARRPCHDGFVAQASDQNVHSLTATVLSVACALPNIYPESKVQDDAEQKLARQTDHQGPKQQPDPMLLSRRDVLRVSVLCQRHGVCRSASGFAGIVRADHGIEEQDARDPQYEKEGQKDP